MKESNTSNEKEEKKETNCHFKPLGVPFSVDILLRMAKRPLHFDKDGNLIADENNPLL